MSDEPAKFILGDTAISSVEEPGRKRFFRRKNRERPPLTHCENCGTQLRGHWCAQCGQPAIDYRRSFRHVIVDVLDSFLNWDSKFFATLGLLIAKPWRLTNEFLAGKRVRYVHPARLYLLASILFFFAVTYWVKSAHLHPKTLTPGARAEIEVELDKEKPTPEQRANVEKALKILPPETTGKIERAIKHKETPTETPKTENATDKELEAKKPDRPVVEFGKDSASSANGFEKWIEGHAKQKLGEHGTNLQLFLITMISNLPYMVLCCIPLFAFVLKILYLRKRVIYIDHRVYRSEEHTSEVQSHSDLVCRLLLEKKKQIRAYRLFAALGSRAARHLDRVAARCPLARVGGQAAWRTQAAPAAAVGSAIAGAGSTGA